MQSRAWTSPRVSTRTAFSITELVVALAIVATLMALLLPAIQSVRESGRQAECRNHLHQFGVAIGAFEGVHRRLPSCSWPRDPSGDFYYRYSAHYQLLPYFEQLAVYQAIDLKAVPPRVVDAPRLTAATKSPPEVFVCPTDPVEGGTNYRLSFGPCGYFCTKDCASAERGAFNRLGGTTLAEIQDGTSQSAALCERYKSDYDVASFSRLDFWYTGRAALPGFPNRDEMVLIARSLRPDRSPKYFHARTGQQWVFGGFAGTWYNHILQPNSDVLDCSMDEGGDAPSDFYIDGISNRDTAVGVHSARSYHPFGVHLLMLDGAVHSENSRVDLAVWRDLGSIATASNR